MRRLLWLTFFVGIGGVGWFVWRKVTGPVSHGPIADAPPHANPQRMTHVATSTSPESTNGDSDAPPDHGHEAVVKKATAKKTAAKKTAAKKAAAKKTAAKKATATKTAVKKATAKKSAAKKTAAKKVPADQPETSSTASSTEERPEA